MTTVTEALQPAGYDRAMPQRPTTPGAILALFLAGCSTAPTSVTTDAATDAATDTATSAHDVDPHAGHLDVGNDVGEDAPVPDLPRAAARDLQVRTAGWTEHPSRLSEFALLDPDGAVRARVLLHGNLAEDGFALWGVLTEAPGRLAWFVDDNDNRMEDAPPLDRAGCLSVGASPGPHTVVAGAETPPCERGTHPPPAGALSARFEEFEVHVGVYFSFTLTPEHSDRTVGMVRIRGLPEAGRFDFVLRDVLAEGQRYTAQWFIDLNDNGVYDPRGDHGGSLSFDGRSAGVLLVHMHHMNRSWVR